MPLMVGVAELGMGLLKSDLNLFTLEFFDLVFRVEYPKFLCSSSNLACMHILTALLLCDRNHSAPFPDSARVIRKRRKKQSTKCHPTPHISKHRMK